MIKKTGLLVYPREYVIAEGDKTGNGYDYVLGVDEKQQAVKVILKYSRDELSKAYEDRDVIHTTIEMLAETGRRAQRPCVADPDNSIDNSEGLLLFERLVSPDFDPQKHEEGQDVPQFKIEGDTRVFEAGWVKILSIDKDDFKPESSVGYVELRANRIKDSDPEKANKEETLDLLGRELNELRGKLIGMEGGPDREIIVDDIRRIEGQVDQINKYSVSLVKVHNKQIQHLESPTKEALLENYKAISSALTSNGRYGGVLLRVHNGTTVVKEMCGEICAKFKGFEADKKTVVISSPEDDLSAWMRFEKGGRILQVAAQKGLKIDLIPIQKINCGGTGNATFNKEDKSGLKDRIRKVRLTYQDVQTGDPIARGVVARMTSDKKGNNDLLGEAHTISEAMGNPFLLTSKVGEMMKLHSLEAAKRKAVPPAKPAPAPNGEAPTP